MKTKIERKPPDLVEVVEVIHVRTTRGDGTEENPVRGIIQFWTLDGQLICETDSNVFQSLR